MEVSFPFHLLPLDLQMYIFTKDPKLLLLSSYLSKSFHHRSRPYLCQQFSSLPLSGHTVINYLITYRPDKWSYMGPGSFKIVSSIELYTCLGTALKKGKYNKKSLYNIDSYYQTDTNYIIYLHPSNFMTLNQLDSDQLQMIYDQSGPWIFDLVTLSQVLSLRKFCCRHDPGYIRNSLLRYLSTLHQEAKTKMEKMTFFMYLILNFYAYDLESLPDSISWNQDIDDLIKIKYEKLVDYLQNN